MNSELEHWFDGLMAERTAAFPPDPWQAPFFQGEIARYGQPATPESQELLFTAIQ
jgi:hypothetical protein